MVNEGSLQLAEPRHPSGQVDGPVCFVKGTPRRSDCGIEIHVVGVGHHPEDLLGGRIDGLEDLARSRRPQLTVDQQALFADDGGRVGGAHRASCPVPTPKMSSQRSSVRVAIGSVIPSVPATSRAARRSLWARAAADRMADTSPSLSLSVNGATVDRNISVDAPPMRASLALTTWASLPRSIPAASARSWPSYAASQDPYWTRLRANLAVSPAPKGPMRTTRELMASSTGRTSSMGAGSPPTMHPRSPLAAALGPPLPPQSTTATPASADSTPMASTQPAEMVLTIRTVVIGPADARAPSGPDRTAWTWASLTTATTTTSERWPSSAGEPASTARPRYFSVASSRTSQTTRGRPAASTLVATPSPISPSPITPTTGTMTGSIPSPIGTRTPLSILRDSECHSIWTRVWTIVWTHDSSQCRSTFRCRSGCRPAQCRPRRLLR